MLKFAIIAAFLAVPAFAEDGDFATRKAEKLKEIDTHIAKMQEHKTCIGAAADGPAMKDCHEKMREFHKEHRMEHLERKGERIDKKIDRMKNK